MSLHSSRLVWWCCGGSKCHQLWVEIVVPPCCDWLTKPSTQFIITQEWAWKLHKTLLWKCEHRFLPAPPYLY
jgi:hypothetical protein